MKLHQVYKSLLNEKQDDGLFFDIPDSLLPSESPVKPFRWPDGTYHWAPYPSFGAPLLSPNLWMQSPTGDPNDDATINWTLQWLDNLSPEQIINNPNLMKWLIDVWIKNGGNLILLERNREFILKEFASNLEYKNYILTKLGDYIIEMNSLNLDPRTNINILDNMLFYLPNYTISDLVGLGIFSWRWLQNILPYGWYPLDPRDQIEFINDPLIEHNPYWPIKFPTSIEWWEYSEDYNPELIDPQGEEPPSAPNFG